MITCNGLLFSVLNHKAKKFCWMYMYVPSPSKPLSQSQEYFPSSWLIQIPFTQGDDSQACRSISHLLPVKPSLHTQVKKESELWKQRNVTIFIQGSYMQVCVKFKDFSRTSKRLSYCFQGLKTYENTDLHVKILLQK